MGLGFEPNNARISSISVAGAMAVTLQQTFATIRLRRTAAANTGWSHNGSVMSLKLMKTVGTFYYEEPKKGLPAISGTLLFEGTRSGTDYSGTAYRLSKNCGPSNTQLAKPRST
jgi:hypothetical protein